MGEEYRFVGGICNTGRGQTDFSKSLQLLCIMVVASVVRGKTHSDQKEFAGLRGLVLADW